jgi:hypothetical protein
MTYTIKRRETAPDPQLAWDSPYWADVNILPIAHFYDTPDSSNHRPKTDVKVVHTGDSIHLFYRVCDQYVRSVVTELNGSVCRDSCVEFFVQPRGKGGYFNFEINCGGTMLLYFIEDNTPANGEFAKYTEVESDIASLVKINSSMPPVVEPEISNPIEWTMKYSIPTELFENFVTKLGDLSGQTWKANFYKCADQTSHPHWASWAPFEGALSFHKPEFFADIEFE